MSIIYRCREASAVVKVNPYILIGGPRDKLSCKLWICVENCTTFSIGQETPTLMNMLFSQLITCWTCKSFPWKQSNGFQWQVIQGTKLGFSSTWARVDLSKCVYVMCPNRVNLLRYTPIFIKLQFWNVGSFSSWWKETISFLDHRVMHTLG